MNRDLVLVHSDIERSRKHLSAPSMPASATYVPSAGALRTLRRLAYAGSVVSSLGAAFVVEEQRRAITVASKARDNAQRLQSCRNYHATRNMSRLQIAPGLDSGVDATDGEVIYWRNNLSPSWGAEAGIVTDDGVLDPGHKRRRASKANRVQKTQSPASSLQISRSADQCLEGESRPRGKARQRTRGDNQLPFHTETAKSGSFIRKVSLIGNEYHSRGGDSDQELPVSHQSTLELAAQASRLLASGQRAEAVADIDNILRQVLPPDVSEAVVELSEKTCIQTIQNEDLRTTKAIMQLLHDKGLLTSKFWTSCIAQLAKQNLHAEALHMYNEFQTKMRLRPDTYRHVIGSLIYELKLQEAGRLLQRAFSQFQVRPGSALHTLPAHLLTSSWRADHRFEKIKELFNWLKTLVPGAVPPRSLFNAMLLACVQARKTEEATQLVSEMTERGLALDGTSHGHLLLALAYKHDWETLNRDFKTMMSDNGLSFTTHRLTSLFNSILKEFRNAHTSDETLAFVNTAFKAYGVEPNNSTLRLMIHKFAEGGDLSRLMEWLQTIGSQASSISISDLVGLITSNDLLISLSWKQRQAILNQIKNLRGFVSGDQLDELVFSLGKDRRPTRTSTSVTGQQKSSPPEKAGKRLSRSWELEQQMKTASARREWQEVVSLFEQGLVEHRHMPSKALVLAVRASLRCEELGSACAVDLIRSSMKRGFATEAAIVPFFVHEMHHADANEHEIIAQARRAFDLLKNSETPAADHVVVSAAHILMNRGNSCAAVNLLRPWVESRKISLAGMTVLLRAYGEQENLSGVRWTVDRLLDECIPLDSLFMRQLHRTKNRFQSASRDRAASQEAGQHVHATFVDLEQRVSARVRAARRDLDRHGIFVRDIVQHVTSQAACADVVSHDEPQLAVEAAA